MFIEFLKSLLTHSKNQKKSIIAVCKSDILPDDTDDVTYVYCSCFFACKPTEGVDDTDSPGYDLFI